MANEPTAAPATSSGPFEGDRPSRPPRDRERGGRGGGGGGGGGFRRFGGRKRVCRLCNKVRCSPGDEYKVDYKDVARLRMFTNERGKIEARRKLSTCALAQRSLSRAVKRARYMALLPYTLEHVRTSRVFPLRG